MSDAARIVLCEACAGEGTEMVPRTWLESHGEWITDLVPDGPCPDCEGTGGEIIETEPIDLDDLRIMAGPPARWVGILINAGEIGLAEQIAREIGEAA